MEHPGTRFAQYVDFGARSDEFAEMTAVHSPHLVIRTYGLAALMLANQLACKPVVSQDVRPHFAEGLCSADEASSIPASGGFFLTIPASDVPGSFAWSDAKEQMLRGSQRAVE